MNAKQRFMQALHRQPVDRPPVGAVVTAVTVPMMEKVGIKWPDAHTDPTLLANLAASVWEVSELECIKLPFCMTVEVETFGATIDFGTYDTLPTETGHIFNHPDEMVVPENFLEMNRVPTVLAAISRLHEKYENEVAIVSSIVGPFALASKMFGFDNFFPWILNHPEYVHQVMKALTPLAIKYANAQAAAGADAILIGEATCSGDLISPTIYRDFVAPYHTELCNAISIPTIMHICGKSTGHIPYLAATGTTAYNFDEGADPDLAREQLKGRVTLIGYVPTVEVLLNGTPEDVYQATVECLATGVDILTPGCSLPQHTSLANIAAMVQATKDWANSAELRASKPNIISQMSAAARRRIAANDPSSKRKRRRRRSG